MFGWGCMKSIFHIYSGRISMFTHEAFHSTNMTYPSICSCLFKNAWVKFPFLPSPCKILVHLFNLIARGVIFECYFS